MKRKAEKILGAALAGCLALSLAQGAFAADSGFAGHWAEDTLEEFVEAGYLPGGEVQPNKPATRAEFAAMLNRIAGYSAKSEEISSYTDVPEGSAYYDDMAIALEAGYLVGDGTKMNPESPIVRQEAFAVLCRVLGLASGDAAVLDAFSDQDRTAAWAVPELAAMVKAGYVSGNANGTLNPTGNLTVAESATVMKSALDELKDIGRPALVSGGYAYGTATLTYAEYYSGDVSSTEGYDAVSSATNSKYKTLKNTSSDFVDAETNADGYRITGVKRVNVRLPEADLAAYKALNPSFRGVSQAPAQYKTVTLTEGKAEYSATVFDVKATVTGAAAELQTNSHWGDYMICVYDPEGTVYLRNARTDEGFAINSNIQGIIVETKEGLKVGMEFLQSIWVQPYEISWNISSVNAGNPEMGFDNLAELSKLEGQTISKVTFIMPDGTYIYELGGNSVYVKPFYADAIGGYFAAGNSAFTLTRVPEGLENGKLTVTYTTGSRRDAVVTTLYEGKVAATVAIDAAALAAAGPDGAFAAVITSDNYADIAVTVAAVDEAGLIYGTATLTYAEFYAGDVSSTEGYDAITSATTGKYNILGSMAHDFVDAETNANGYHITGVKNVNVAVSKEDLAAYQALNGSFAPVSEKPAQYKTVTVQNGKAAYSATKFDVKDTVTNAAWELETGVHWGDYELLLNDWDGEGAANHLRHDRNSDNYDVNSEIQGIILETGDGLRVGLGHLASIWVNPYEFSWNIGSVNAGNPEMGYGNLAELSKLEGATLTKVTFIMQNGVYDYVFDGIYLKPFYHGALTGSFNQDHTTLTLSQVPKELENAKVTVTYTVGSRRDAVVTTLYEGELKQAMALDAAALASAAEGGTYAVAITSDSHADINLDISEPAAGSGSGSGHSGSGHGG